MKTTALALLLGLCLALATGAGASAATTTTTADDIAVLKRQVAALTKQTKTLQAQVKKLQTQQTTITRALDANFVGDICQMAITADAFQGTWLVIDQLATATGQKTFFTPAASVDDKRACAVLIPPIVRQSSLPPTTATFQGWINWLTT